MTRYTLFTHNEIVVKLFPAVETGLRPFATIPSVLAGDAVDIFFEYEFDFMYLCVEDNHAEKPRFFVVDNEGVQEPDGYDTWGFIYDIKYRELSPESDFYRTVSTLYKILVKEKYGR